MKNTQSAVNVVRATRLTLMVAFALCAMDLSAAWADGVKSVEIPGVASAVQTEDGDVTIAGQPAKETLEAAAKKGVKVVLNLRRPDEMAKLPLDEKTVTESLGMKYIQVPMTSALPKDDAIKTVLDALADSKANPVLLHCASGNRAGGMWALYLGTRKGVDADAAIAEGKKAGLNNDALEHVVRTRIAATAKK